MRKLIKAVRIIDPGGPHHGETLDLFISDGQIADLGESLKLDDVEEISAKGLCVSPGFVDIGTRSGDPGYEHREDRESLIRAASMGGYTHLAVLPTTAPIIDSKAEVVYQQSLSKKGQLAIHPFGAISKDTAGKDITEMMDMRRAGALAFSDGNHPVQHAGLMLRALLYVKSFDGIIINQAMDESIAINGQMHEGLVSTALGLRGISALSEELMVERDLRLLAYTESRLHLHNISSAGAVQQVRAAKAQGLRVTASVPALNLAFTDEALGGFDSNYKVMPPLRSEEDRQALIAGLKDGTIDIISSNHCPLEPEEKELEFAYAGFGVVGLSTCFALCNGLLTKDLDLAQLVACISHKPREIFGLESGTIKKGVRADLCVYDPSQVFELESSGIGSKSKNTPLLGETLKGKIIQTYLG